MKPLKFFAYSLIILSMAGLSSCSGGKKEWTLTSPSGNIRLTITSGENRQLYYHIAIVDSGIEHAVINASPLGLRRNDGDFITGLSFLEASPVSQIVETMDGQTGKKAIRANPANEQTLTFKNTVGAKIQLIIRAYDDGIAFRYIFPDKDSTRYTVEEEVTGFALAGEGKAWMQPYDKVTQWSPAYETYYEREIPIGTAAPSTEGWSFPALFSTQKAWLLLTEAAVDSFYAGAHLNSQADQGLYTIRMPEESEAGNIVPQKPSSALPWRMPWRVMIIGKELSTIVESDLVSMLNPPSEIADQSWIKPGRASWSWWSDAASPRNFASLKKFVDLAVTMGWDYSLVDANWDLMVGGTIEQLITYANSRNIGIWMWYNSGGAHNSVTERPRDIMSDPVKRKEEFKKLAELGVKGVKVDFFQSDKQGIIKQYFDILKDAADNRIMVNFHGCTLPRGWNRTWPNLISMEAVRGAECYGFDSLFTDHAPWHNATLPFTRNVVGSMDYTPVTFTDQKYPHITTWGHELALTVVFESGMLHFADRVDAYLTLPEEPKNFLKNVPVLWDETRLLAGEPGVFCVMARRKDDTWYLGGINGTDSLRSLEIDISKLANTDFFGQSISDSPDGRHFRSETLALKAGEKLRVDLLPRGGFVATLNKEK